MADATDWDPAAFTREVARLRDQLMRLSTSDASPEADVLRVELATSYEELQAAGEEVRAQQDELARLAQARDLEHWRRRRLLGRLPAPVLVTNHRGMITFANSAAAAVVGRKVTQVQRAPIASLVDSGDRGRVRTLLSEALASPGRMIEGQGVRLRPSGSGEPATIELLVEAGPVADEGTPDEITWLLLGEDRDGLPAEHVARPKEFAHALVDLATLPLHAGDDQKVLTEAVRICRRGLGEGYAVSLVVGTPAEPELVASSDAFAQQLDGMQAIASEGPCLDAWTTGHPVVATDLVHEERWPTLTADLASVPIQSMRASPIAIREQPLGVLNLYGTDHDLAAPDLTDLTDLVGLLAGALAAVLYEIAAKAELETLADQLNVALESRATIDQAKGIVMATMGCGPAEAYDLLKKISNDTNTKVRDVASDTVHRASTDGNEADAPL